MGFFDKLCPVCGEKTGLLGNLKLADGTVCRSCGKKLSVFYKTDGATVADVKAHIQYREQNKAALRSFSADKVIGAEQPIGPARRLCIDSQQGKFLFSVKNDAEAENPDVFDVSSIKDVGFYIQEFTDKAEQYSSIDYYYTFYLTLALEHPFIHTAEFKLNNRSVITNKHVDDNRMRDVYEGRSDMGDIRSSLKSDDRAQMEYLKYYTVLSDMVAALTNAAQLQPKASYETHTLPRFCPHCGKSVEGGAFCTGCGNKLINGENVNG